MTISSIRSLVATAVAAIRARCPKVTAMRVGVAAFAVALIVSVGGLVAAVKQVAAADAAAATIAAEVTALRDKLSAPPAAPAVGYDGQVAAWCRARLDFSAKK